MRACTVPSYLSFIALAIVLCLHMVICVEWGWSFLGYCLCVCMHVEVCMACGSMHVEVCMACGGELEWEGR